MTTHLEIPTPIRKLIKATEFWQDNYLILREFKYFRRITIIAAVSILMAAFLEGISVGLIASFLQGLTNPGEPPITTGIHWLDVSVLATKASPTARVYRLSAVILISVWLLSCLSYVGIYYSRLCQYKLLERVRLRIFEQLQSLSMSYYSKVRSGDLINTVTTEVNELKQACNILSIFITRGSSLLAYVVSMFWISWQLSIVSIMLFALLSVGLSTLIKRVREASFKIPPASSRIVAIAIEFINGIRTVKGSVTQDFESQRFSQANTEWIKVNAEVHKVAAAIKPISEASAITILIGMVVIAFRLFIAEGNLQAASLLTFMFVLFRMMPLVTLINDSRQRFNAFQGSIDNIKNLLKTNGKVYLPNGHQRFSELKHGIDLVSVDFAYSTDEPILHDITLSLEKGKTTALVGSSGAGKTTLADLIPRFYDPTAGKILVDGLDLRQFDINSFRKRLAIVSQDTFIFNNTVAHNIAYGIKNIDYQAIEKAARQANAWEFIQELPLGLDNVLGDRGVRLSGGQRQRIAIARALLSNPEILILDEATSALDSVTENLIQESLERLANGKTVIAIAHRLSTIIKADKVVVLEQGRIVEQGKYQELLEKRGRLWQYHEMQYGLEQAAI